MVSIPFGRRVFYETSMLLSFQGMLVVESEVVTDQKILLNLWKHECTRVIADRFISSTDKEWFEKTIKIVADEDLGQEVASLMNDEPYFVDFLRDAPEMTGNAFCFSFLTPFPSFF